MTANNIRRITDQFAARIVGTDRVPDPIGVFSEFSAAMARDLAETVFFKVQTEAGWTAGEAQALADQTLHGQILAITDTVHAHGGSLEMAQAAGQAAAVAYGARLVELTKSFGQGGAA